MADSVDCEPPDVPVPLRVAPVPELPEVLPVPVAVEVADEAAPDAVGRPAKSAADSNGTQLEDAGTRGWYGIVEIAPKLSGG